MFMKQIKNNLKIGFAVLLLGSLFLSGIPVGAEPLTDLSPVEPAPQVVEKVSVRGAEQPMNGQSALNERPSELDERSMNNALFLLQIQNELKEAYSDYHKLNSVIGQSREKVGDIRGKLGTLRDQIISFQEEITLTEERIKNVATQVGLKSKEIGLLEEEIVSRSIALDQQKALLADYMRMIYISENRFRDEAGLNPAKLLLADENIGDILSQMRTLDMFQYSGQQMLERLRSAQDAIADIQREVKVKKASLDFLKDTLLAQRSSLEDSKNAKAHLLAATHNDEETYQKFIVESERQQEESVLQIAALQENFNYIRDNLGRLGNNISPSELQKLLDERTRQLYAYQQQIDNDSGFLWPVRPARGLSAYFDDAGYRARFGVDHRAIDIPVSQGSAIHAPKDGYVYRAKDNGLGYSYIILSHKDGLMTVYGHVSSILVREGQFVKTGSVLGLTGGMPGTSGAGYRTTGPHLHFEIHLRGKPVDPLDYLSLTKLSLEDLPAKYAKRVEVERARAFEGEEERDAAGVRGTSDESGVSGRNETSTGRENGLRTRENNSDQTDALDELMEKQIREDVVRFAEENGEREIEAYEKIFGE